MSSTGGNVGRVGGLVPAELHREDGEGAPDREDVARDTRADLADLGGLVAECAVDRGLLVVDAPHAAEVDELDRVPGLDHVVGFEVAVQQPLRVQVRERGQDLDDVGDGLVGGHRVVLPAVRLQPILQDLLQRPTTDVLHDDVAGAVEVGEVVDLEDERVLHFGEELALGDGGLERVGVAGVQQSLQDDVALGHVVVTPEIDPAEPAVRDAADHLVLAADDVACVQLGCERVRRAALRAEALGPARLPVPRPSDG